MRLAMFYHCVFYLGDPPKLLPPALPVVMKQMALIRKSGLLDALDMFVVGCNGSSESESLVKLCIPSKARVVMHGLDSRSENLTLMERERFVMSLPEGDEWLILYAHSKSVTHDPSGVLFRSASKIRECMDEHCINDWVQCVMDLLAGYEAVGCHWLQNMGSDKSQHLFGGTTFWTTSTFLRTIPSMMTRARIQQDGIAALSSRYEAEIIIGNGPRLPRVKDYCPLGYVACSTC